LDQFSRLFGKNLRSATVTEKLILDCLGAAVGGVEAVISKRCAIPIKVVATWTPGPDLTVKDAVPTDGSQSQQRLATLERLRRDAEKRTLLASLISAVLIVVGSVARIVTPIGPASQAFMIAYGMLFGVVALSNRATATSTAADIAAARAQEDLSELIDEPRERRAQKMFQVHSEQLKRYYDQALQQRGYIFATGVLCILTGFAVIAAAFWLLVSTDASNTVKLLIGALGAVGGILGNFIAVVYLRMFTETVKSVGSFHNRLVTTHHLHFANFLIAKISSGAARDAFFGAVAEIAAADDRKLGGDSSNKGPTKKKPRKRSASAKDAEVFSDASESEALTNTADLTE
jgi:hypothetical protein